jgi:hypothetical protein
MMVLGHSPDLADGGEGMNVQDASVLIATIASPIVGVSVAYIGRLTARDTAKEAGQAARDTAKEAGETARDTAKEASQTAREATAAARATADADRKLQAKRLELETSKEQTDFVLSHRRGLYLDLEGILGALIAQPGPKESTEDWQQHQQERFHKMSLMRPTIRLFGVHGLDQMAVHLQELFDEYDALEDTSTPEADALWNNIESEIENMSDAMRASLGVPD